MKLVEVLRGRNYAFRTEKTYLKWVERFLHMKASSSESPTEVEGREFLERLAVRGGVVASTQKLALNALAFFFRQVFKCRESTVCGFYVSEVEPSDSGGAFS